MHSPPDLVPSLSVDIQDATRPWLQTCIQWDAVMFQMFQILDQGFILHPGAYMRDFWNIMDITVVSCALTSFYHTVA